MEIADIRRCRHCVLLETVPFIELDATGMLHPARKLKAIGYFANHFGRGHWIDAAIPVPPLSCRSQSLDRANSSWTIRAV